MEKAEVSRLKLEDILKKIFIALALILLFLSIWGLYTAINELIGIWISYKYAPIYRALLNLAVLLMVIYVLARLIKNEA